jgi:hypothetical protein
LREHVDVIIGDEQIVVDQLVELGGSDASIRLEDDVSKVSAPSKLFQLGHNKQGKSRKTEFELL